MVKIAPSILSADCANLEREIRAVSSADYLHVDVMDGVFVPNLAFGIPVVRSVRRVTELPLDVHLMITSPLRYAEQFCAAGADIVSMHVEACPQEDLLTAIRIIHDKGKRAGVVLKPGTKVESVFPFLEEVDLILAMTVEPGFGGQDFMEEVLPKIRDLRLLIDRYRPGCELEADGGIGPDTCRACIEAGADVLVSGSSIFHTEDKPGRIRELRG